MVGEIKTHPSSICPHLQRAGIGKGLWLQKTEMGESSEADGLREEHMDEHHRPVLNLSKYYLPQLGEPRSFHQCGPIPPGFLESLCPSKLDEDFASLLPASLWGE